MGDAMRYIAIFLALVAFLGVVVTAATMESSTEINVAVGTGEATVFITHETQGGEETNGEIAVGGEVEKGTDMEGKEIGEEMGVERGAESWECDIPIKHPGTVEITGCSWEGNDLVLDLLVTTPTPCHTVKSEVKGVAGEYRVKLTLVPGKSPCVEVIDRKKVSVKVGGQGKPEKIWIWVIKGYAEEGEEERIGCAEAREEMRRLRERYAGAGKEEKERIRRRMYVLEKVLERCKEEEKKAKEEAVKRCREVREKLLAAREAGDEEAVKELFDEWKRCVKAKMIQILKKVRPRMIEVLREKLENYRHPCAKYEVLSRVLREMRRRNVGTREEQKEVEELVMEYRKECAKAKEERAERVEELLEAVAGKVMVAAGGEANSEVVKRLLEENRKLREEVKRLRERLRGAVLEIARLRRRIRILRGKAVDEETGIEMEDVNVVVPTEEGNVTVEVSGETKISDGEAEAEVNTEIEVSEEGIVAKGKRIRMLPKEVRKRIVERMRAELRKLKLEEREGKVVYRALARKRARLFLIIPVEYEVEAEIDPETGEEIRVKRPWWAFLAWG